MINYVLDYLSARDTFAANSEEQNSINAGIKLWLLDNGINETDQDEYRKKYIVKALEQISVFDLKQYFITYPIASEVFQIIFECKEDGKISPERKNELYDHMKTLYEAGIGDKYLPATEIRSILD